MTVVSAGIKSILDVAATLERLETLGVTLLGWRTDRFPGFWVSDSGEPLDWVVPDAETVAQAIHANDALGRRSAILVAAPVPLISSSIRSCTQPLSRKRCESRSGPVCEARR